MSGLQVRFKFFIGEQDGEQRILQLQQGVFRTNCIDCLDRTNVLQTHISKRILQHLLRQINEKKDATGGNDFTLLRQGLDEPVALNLVFSEQDASPATVKAMDLLKDLWCRNGDCLSRQYTGTESNISRVTKQNKQGFMGKLEQWQVGISRYYQYLVNDNFKHECI